MYEVTNTRVLINKCMYMYERQISVTCRTVYASEQTDKNLYIIKYICEQERLRKRGSALCIYYNDGLRFFETFTEN